MFTCPYQHCGVTFSRRAALREHTKSHKGQAYWEILTDTSSNFNNLGENNITVIIYLTPITFFIL